MKIIQAPKDFTAIEFACPTCDAKLMADSPEDFLRNRYSDFRESWDYAEVTCPFCKTKIEFSKDKFPKHVYNQFKEKGTY